MAETQAADPQADLSFSESFGAVCPLCGIAFQARRWSIVDADRRPDLVVHARDGSLQRSFCPRCIGPGVEEPSSFCVIKRNGGDLECHIFGQGEPDAFASETEAIYGRLVKVAELNGFAKDSIRHLGSNWIQAPREIADIIDETWPQLDIRFDPAMLAGPLSELLRSNNPGEQAAALIKFPDLARPNVELLLTRMASEASEALGISALTARFFIAAARALGLEEATRRAEAKQARSARVSALPDAFMQRLNKFIRSKPDSGEFSPLTLMQEAEALGKELDEAGLADMKAELWMKAGQWLRQRPDVQECMPLAARAYSLGLKAVEAGNDETAYRLLLGLSSVWDLRPDGIRSENVDNALECAAAARDFARTLPVDEQAEAAMEQGILYIHRPTGDPHSNLALAREALSFAHETALSADLRMSARYNFALADVEDADERYLARGIARLQSLSGPDVYNVFFDQLQQQHLFQSLGVALAKRATSANGAQPEDLSQAAEFIERALEIARLRNSEHDVAFLAGILARVEADLTLQGSGTRDLSEILELLDEAGSSLSPEKAPTAYAQNELRRAGILIDLGKPELVSEMTAQALTNACRVFTPDDAPDLCRRAQSQLAELRFRQKDFKAAAAAFATACQASENAYGQAESVTQRAVEVAPNANLYAGLVDSLAYLASGGEDASWSVLEAMEAGRARLTLDLMGLRPLPHFPGIPDELIETEARLISQLAWTVPGAARDLVREDPERLRQQRVTQRELRDIWSRIAASGESGRRYAELRQSRPPTREQMATFAAQLGAGAALASFFLLQDRIVGAWLRAGRAPRIVSIDLPYGVLRDRWIGAFRRDVLAASPDEDPPHDWLALGEVLFRDFVRELSELELLVLIPHQDLHVLPLHALTVEGRPLIDQVPVMYGPSVGVLASILEGEQADGTQKPALVASHAATREEAEEFEGEADLVAQRLGTRAQHHARKQAIAAAAPSAQLIHLACHGYFDSQNPLESGILLADGVMRARDWLALSLRSDLVTLSACETGRQQIRAGDELSGVARTLIQAGSASVLLTLWRVYSDSTAEWMSLFYVDPPARSGLALAKAFQRATVQLRARDPDARAWAPFVLIGIAGLGATS